MVRIVFEGIKLPNLDTHSQTDGFCVLYLMNENKKVKLGQTEVVADCLNPRWVKNIDVNYALETESNLRVEVYDADDVDKLDDISAHDFIGGFDFKLS